MPDIMADQKLDQDALFPEDKTPPCWADDARMSALFAPFRTKALNPESWDMKMTFWSDMLKKWCSLRKDPIVSVKSAKAAFQRKGNRPAGLDIVFEELVKKGDLVLPSKYTDLVSASPQGWLRWGAKQAFRPAGFAVGLLASLLPFRAPTDNYGLPKASIDPEQTYVLDSLVKEQVADLVFCFPEDGARVGTLEELMEAAGRAPEQRPAFTVLLGYMLAHKLATRQGDLYKIADCTGQLPAPITETERALHALRGAERELEVRLQGLLAEAERHLMNARVALQRKDHDAAKAHLRRRKRTQLRAAPYEEGMENVRHMAFQLRHADTNAQVVSAYRMSSNAMKAGMETVNVDTVMDTMDEIKEIMESCDDMNAALSEPLTDSESLELEDELEALLASGPPAGSPGGAPSRQRRLSVPDKDYVFDGEERVIAELNDLSHEDHSVEDKEKMKEMATKNQKKAPLAVVDGGAQGDPDIAPSKSSTPPSKAADSNKRLWSNTNFESEKENREEIKPDKEEEWPKQPNAAFKDSEIHEIQFDTRLHPGQRLNPSQTPSNRPVVYNTDFEIQDHNFQSGVWTFNPRVNDHEEPLSINEDFLEPMYGNNNSYLATDSFSICSNAASRTLEANKDHLPEDNSPKRNPNLLNPAPGSERHTRNKETEHDLADIERRLQALRKM